MIIKCIQFFIKTKFIQIFTLAIENHKNNNFDVTKLPYNKINSSLGLIFTVIFGVLKNDFSFFKIKRENFYISN